MFPGKDMALQKVQAWLSTAKAASEEGAAGISAAQGLCSRPAGGTRFAPAQHGGKALLVDAE